MDTHYEEASPIATMLPGTNAMCNLLFVCFSGYKVKLFKMEYVSRLYVWTEVASSYLPRDHQDLGVIPKLLGLITRLKVKSWPTEN